MFRGSEDFRSRRLYRWSVSDQFVRLNEEILGNATQSKARVGDTVRVNGAVRLDKDLVSGYRYDVIIEDAKVTVE